jgi:hypothetical protein
MTAPDRQLELISALMELDPPILLFGGFAEDAVLHGSVARPHDDIDVVVWRDELDLRVAQLNDLGFATIEVRFEPAPNRPLVVVATDGDAEVELVVADRTEGRASFDLPGEQGVDRVWMPPDFASTPVRRLGPISVRTISPLALYQVRAASAEVFGGFRPKDVEAQAALRSRFFADVGDAELQPDVTPWSGG